MTDATTRVKLFEVRSEYEAWSKSHNSTEAKASKLASVKKEMYDIINYHPQDAAQMLTMYYLTCGPIST